MSVYEEKQTALAMAVPDPDKYRDPLKMSMRLTKADMLVIGRLIGVRHEQILAAIGRLTVFAVAGNYDDCMMYRDCNDIMCSYKAADGRKFFICAHWDEFSGEWGFHS